MQKIDYRKKYNEYYSQRKNVISIVNLPPMNFLMIDGSEDPNNNPRYSESLNALYALAYTLKFKVKKSSLAIDYKVMPLEGLWWADDMSEFKLENRSNWKWTMMIMQPDFITYDLVEKARAEVVKKKNPPQLSDVYFDSYEEGLAAQIFHSGPYGEAEIPTVNKLHAFIKEQSYRLQGKHHEIYLNSPLRTAPEKLRIIIRQPITKNNEKCQH